MGENDKLSKKERRQIKKKLGISSDLGGSDDYGRDAYLLLKVPDFGEPNFPNTEPDDVPFLEQTYQPEDATGTARRLQSYLRLGSFHYESESPAAKKLLEWIPQANAASDPDISDATKTHPLDDMADDTAGMVFVDDSRTRLQDVSSLATVAGAVDPDHGLSRTERQAESQQLYARGGWRDHSDGNRISTTWGDKVEVVRGNYKMFVMGRQEVPDQAMGWEATGGHIQDFAPGTMPGASYFLEWIDDPSYYAASSPEPFDGRKGLWLLCNTTENVYEYARNAGNFREEAWGDVHETYVGSENPPDGTFATTNTAGTDGHEVGEGMKLTDGRSYDLPGSSGKDGRATPPWGKDNIGMVRSNPHIIEKTWAKRIDSWTGSPGCPVDDIREQTDCSGAIVSTTHAGAVNERAAVGAMASSTITSHIAETLVSVSRLSTTAMLGLDIDAKYVLGEAEAKIVSGNTTSFQLASTTLGISITTLLDVEFNTHLDVATIDIVVGKHLDISTFTQKFEIALGAQEALVVGSGFELKLGAFDDHTLPEAKETAVEKKQTIVNQEVALLKSEMKAAKMALLGLTLNLN